MIVLCTKLCIMFEACLNEYIVHIRYRCFYYKAKCRKTKQTTYFRKLIHIRIVDEPIFNPHNPTNKTV